MQIEVNGVQRHRLVEHGLDPASPDNRIIGAALGQAEQAPTRIVSNDAALRIKAAHLGLGAAEHRPIDRAVPRWPAGWTTLDATPGDIDDLYREGRVAADRVAPGPRQENTFAVLRAGSQSALARARGNELVLLPAATSEAWGLRPRSKEPALRPRAPARS